MYPNYGQSTDFHAPRWFLFPPTGRNVPQCWGVYKGRRHPQLCRDLVNSNHNTALNCISTALEVSEETLLLLSWYFYPQILLNRREIRFSYSNYR